jgi:hypothetical protein
MTKTTSKIMTTTMAKSKPQPPVKASCTSQNHQKWKVPFNATSLSNKESASCKGKVYQTFMESTLCNTTLCIIDCQLFPL